MGEKVDTLLKINIGDILKKLKDRYGLNLPEKVVMIDYDDENGTLFIRFNHKEIVDGENIDDSLVIIHYARDEEITAIEILDITEFL